MTWKKIFFPKLSSLKCSREMHNLNEQFRNLCKANNSIFQVCLLSPSSYFINQTLAMCWALCNAPIWMLEKHVKVSMSHWHGCLLSQSTSAQSSPAQFNSSSPTHLFTSNLALSCLLFLWFLPSHTSSNSVSSFIEMQPKSDNFSTFLLLSWSSA